MNINFSVAQIEDAPPSIRIALTLQMQKFHKKPYSEFVDLIHEAVYFSISRMSAAKNITAGMDEDQLTNLLLTPLATMAFDASHSKNVGGNCDIVVNGHSEYIWLAEAKKFSSYSKLLGGYRQLVNRYSTGLQNQDHGSLLIYMVSHGNAKKRMLEWEAYLTDVEAGISTKREVTRPLEFDSTQEHAGSGLPIYVRHTPVILYHVPTDTQKAPPRKKSNS
ncbi:hypothetical protein [Sphingomonas sp. CFBP 13706]|uniref:hypothetical protein n=1 Tax=Sphingomonas sp. CFBP 13706 TaxID=2775314 RepID=UPI001785D28A|nr:hypothetical protein [Sphingomonas sp. CFBP 13706]MBD8737773.1 hypothetical protein [Sphingomonas sp. CFBP 13706]